MLVVGAGPLLCASVAHAYRKQGWAVDVSAGGDEGASLFEQHLHDVVIMDMAAPRLNGMALLRRLKSARADTRVLMIMANGSIDQAVQAMREGAADFITRPFSLAPILARLDSVISVPATSSRCTVERSGPPPPHKSKAVQRKATMHMRALRATLGLVLLASPTLAHEHPTPSSGGETTLYIQGRQTRE